MSETAPERQDRWEAAMAEHTRTGKSLESIFGREARMDVRSHIAELLGLFGVKLDEKTIVEIQMREPDDYEEVVEVAGKLTNAASAAAVFGG